MTLVYVVTLIFIISCIQSSQQTDSCNLSGRWKNTHGSVLNINETSDGVLEGSFRTTVEAISGSAGSNKTATLLGQKHTNPTVFSFSVIWDQGSTTAWVGQCYKHKDRDELRTMWLLRSPTKRFRDSWLGTRVGQDIFLRM